MDGITEDLSRDLKLAIQACRQADRACNVAQMFLKENDLEATNEALNMAREYLALFVKKSD